MLALVMTYIETARISEEQFFRAAYLRKFQRDCVLQFIREDVATFKKTGAVPQYVIDFMLDHVSRHSAP